MKNTVNDKGNSAKKTIETLDPGSTADFPIGQVDTIRFYASVLNSKFFLQERRWRVNALRDEGIVRVTRER